MGLGLLARPQTFEAFLEERNLRHAALFFGGETILQVPSDLRQLSGVPLPQRAVVCLPLGLQGRDATIRRLSLLREACSVRTLKLLFAPFGEAFHLPKFLLAAFLGRCRPALQLELEF